MGRVLFIATSHQQLGDTGKETGCWAEEIMAPYLMVTAAGHEVDIASIQGGKIPIDPMSLGDDYKTAKVKEFMGDDSKMKLLENSKAISDVSDVLSYDAVFVPGGHGVCFDAPKCEPLLQMLSKAADADKIVASVCHGPAALVNVKLADGTPLVKGKTVAGFSNSEEKAVGAVEAVPFSLEDELQAQGGSYTKGDDWHPHAIASGKLITGQNPQSSEAVAELLLTALKK